MKKPKLNPVTGDWEVVPDDWVLTYVPDEGTCRFAPLDGVLGYGAPTGRFKECEPGATCFSPPADRFELGTEAYERSYNSVIGGWGERM